MEPIKINLARETTKTIKTWLVLFPDGSGTAFRNPTAAAQYADTGMGRAGLTIVPLEVTINV